MGDSNWCLNFLMDYLNNHLPKWMLLNNPWIIRVLLNSIVNAVNKESIGHILLQSSTNQIMCISIIRWAIVLNHFNNCQSYKYSSSSMSTKYPEPNVMDYLTFSFKMIWICFSGTTPLQSLQQWLIHQKTYGWLQIQRNRAMWVDFVC